MMRVPKIISITFIVFLLFVGCNSSESEPLVYDISKEYIVSEDTNSETDLFYLDQNIETVVDICEHEKLYINEPIQFDDKADEDIDLSHIDGHYSVMIGKEHDITMLFDEDGLCYHIEIYNGIETKKHILEGSSLNKVRKAYGDEYTLIEYKDKLKELIYEFDRYTLTFFFVDNNLYSWGIGKDRLGFYF